MTEKPWNWLEFLEAALDDEPAQAAYLCALHLSRDWPTCACGELCKALPRRGESKAPDDVSLIELGGEFMNNVTNRYWWAALETFRQIEARTAVLLGEMKSNPVDTGGCV